MGYDSPLRDTEPSRARVEATRALVSYMSASIRRGPILVRLTDLHWADDSVLALLDELVERLAATPLVVLATGYKGQEQLVRKLFGDEVAARVGPIWGFGTGQELRNMFMRTPQPGLWFIAGSLAQCRIYSRYLALQIKVREEGLIQ